MGFGPSGPRILPAAQEGQGLAQLAQGIESVLAAAKQERDFTRGTEEFEKLLKKNTSDGQTNYEGLSFDIAASRNISPSLKERFGSVADQQAQRQLKRRELDIQEFKTKGGGSPDKAPPDVQKYLDSTSSAAAKAQTGLQLLDQIDQVLETGTGPFGILPLSNPVTGSIQEFTGIKSGDQNLLENLSFQLVTNAFPTLPRIKSEFDKLLRSNPSIVNTPEGNKKISSAIRKGFEIAIERQNIVNELRNRGVPESQLEREVNRRISDSEKRLEREISSDIKTLNKASELELIEEELARRGAL